jgi:hypothetical protein
MERHSGYAAALGDFANDFDDGAVVAVSHGKVLRQVDACVKKTG